MPEHWSIDGWTAFLTAVATLVATLRGRDAWHRLRARAENVSRCPVCGHRCATCKLRSDPPPEDPFEDETTPRKRFGKG